MIDFCLFVAGLVAFAAVVCALIWLALPVLEFVETAEVWETWHLPLGRLLARAGRWHDGYTETVRRHLRRLTGRVS